MLNVVLEKPGALRRMTVFILITLLLSEGGKLHCLRVGVSFMRSTMGRLNRYGDKGLE